MITLSLSADVDPNFSFPIDSEHNIAVSELQENISISGNDITGRLWAEAPKVYGYLALKVNSDIEGVMVRANAHGGTSTSAGSMYFYEDGVLVIKGVGLGSEAGFTVTANKDGYEPLSIEYHTESMSIRFKSKEEFTYLPPEPLYYYS